jgi:hypothetical protein
VGASRGRRIGLEPSCDGWRHLDALGGRLPGVEMPEAAMSTRNGEPPCPLALGPLPHVRTRPPTRGLRMRPHRIKRPSRHLVNWLSQSGAPRDQARTGAPVSPGCQLPANRAGLAAGICIEGWSPSL